MKKLKKSMTAQKIEKEMIYLQEQFEKLQEAILENEKEYSNLRGKTVELNEVFERLIKRIFRFVETVSPGENCSGHQQSESAHAHAQVYRKFATELLQWATNNGRSRSGEVLDNKRITT